MRASETERAVICPASLVLPRKEHRTAKADEAADWGHICHAWVETGETEDETLERKILLSRIDRTYWWPPGEHELTFALHLHDLKLVKYDGPREDANAWKARYYGKPEWLTGTVDYRGRYRGRPWVDDLKTGRWPVPYTKRQITTYSLLGWIEEGCPLGSELYHRSITQWPKYPLNSQPRRTGLKHPLTTLDLACHLDDLRWASEHPDEVNPQGIYIGPYEPDRELSNCAFCPCRVPIPGLEWMSNYRYRAAEHCWPGLMKRINEENE